MCTSIKTHPSQRARKAKKKQAQFFRRTEHEQSITPQPSIYPRRQTGDRAERECRAHEKQLPGRARARAALVLRVRALSIMRARGSCAKRGPPIARPDKLNAYRVVGPGAACASVWVEACCSLGTRLMARQTGGFGYIELDGFFWSVSACRLAQY